MSRELRMVSAPMGAVLRGRGKQEVAYLTHAVKIDENDDVVSVVCGRAKPEHILGDLTAYNGPKVDCPRCLQLIKRNRLTFTKDFPTHD